jgi:hypothetical protein
MWRDLQYDLLVLRSTFPIRNQNVDVATTRVKTICCFSARVRYVDHFTLNSRGAIDRPTVRIITWLK